jgi:hypothetical protein
VKQFAQRALETLVWMHSLALRAIFLGTIGSIAAQNIPVTRFPLVLEQSRQLFYTLEASLSS